MPLFLIAEGLTASPITVADLEAEQTIVVRWFDPEFFARFSGGLS